MSGFSAAMVELPGAEMRAVALPAKFLTRFVLLALISHASVAPEYIANRECSVPRISYAARAAFSGGSPSAPNYTCAMRTTPTGSAPLLPLIPFPNHPCTLTASLAVRLYCRRLAFAFTNDVEME